MKQESFPIAYIGPSGAGLGFSLSGIFVEETDDPNRALALVKEWKADGTRKIIFMDEGLAGPNLGAIRSLNEDALPAIMLLPNPSNPTHTAAKNLEQLMIRAVGSDIFAS
ncbi:MAG TPA: V-type ATP synthase subunit F [Candidatus Andersenbacteria bacterium]|nr:V-type ATP synthase subunit F [Candidatus Andersenbacteria bacterium]